MKQNVEIRMAHKAGSYMAVDPSRGESLAWRGRQVRTAGRPWPGGGPRPSSHVNQQPCAILVT